MHEERRGEGELGRQHSAAANDTTRQRATSPLAAEGGSNKLKCSGAPFVCSCFHL